MFRKLFGNDVVIRFRPSFFSFTEPSVEVDMQWKGKWLEMGAQDLFIRMFSKLPVSIPANGRALPSVSALTASPWLKFGIDDIRFLYNGDLRLVDQF